MHESQISARVAEIYDELSSKNVSAARVDELSAEMDRLGVAYRNHKSAREWAGSADPHPYGGAPDQPAGIPQWQLPEGQGSRLAQRKWHAPSPFDLGQDQLAALFEAGKHKTAFSTRIGESGMRNKMLDSAGIRDKATTAVAEGAPGSLIPPILLPQAYTLRLEPTRIIEFLVTGQPPTGQSVSWLQHSGNTNPAAAVAELNPKPDIAPQTAVKETTFSVIAGMASASRQILSNFESMIGFLPQELYKAVVLEENDQLLNGNGTAPNQLGLFNTTGILTRTYTSGGADTQIDTLVEAANDIRVGSAYADADLIILNPSDWVTIRRLKTTFNSYILDPNDPNTLGGVDNIFGIRVVTSMSCRKSIGNGFQDCCNGVDSRSHGSNGESIWRLGIPEQRSYLPL
jgi:HK97 family phage major capsid protein